MFDLKEIVPGDSILVRSSCSRVKDRRYFVVPSINNRTKYQLEDSFGRVTASKILKKRRWQVDRLPAKFK